MFLRTSSRRWAICLFAALGLLVFTVTERGADTTATETAALPDGLYADFVMPRGTVTCELFYRRVPLPVTSFVGLAECTLAPIDGHPFFHGLKWYRVVPNFVIQSGNPGLKDTGDEPRPYAFPDQFVPGLHHDSAGILSMANAGPDTNGCEFFITLRDTNRLNYLHSVFGRVVRGVELLPQIQPDETIAAINIRRIGPDAQAFHADQASFDALRGAAKKYPFTAEPGPTAHFDDPDQLLPTDPPRAQNFNFKLANFERTTGVRIFARLLAKSPPDTDARKLGAYTRTLAEKLGVAERGVLALYVADRDEWRLWIGDDLAPAFMNRKGTVKDFMQDGAFHQAKQDLLTTARTQAAAYVTEAERSTDAGHPVPTAQKIKLFVDAVLDGLVFKLEPK